MAGVGERAALERQEHGAAGGIERRAVDVAARNGVLELAGVAQVLEAEAMGERPEVLGEAHRARPAGIVRGERCAKIRQESGVETGVMRDQHIGTEGADRGGQGGEDLGQAGLARDVLRGEVMHGGGGGRDVALGVDEAGVQGLPGVLAPGGRVDDADADGGNVDDAMLAGVEAGGFDVNGDGANGGHGGILSGGGWSRTGTGGAAGWCSGGCSWREGGGGRLSSPAPPLMSMEWEVSGPLWPELAWETRKRPEPGWRAAAGATRRAWRAMRE